MKEKTLLAIYQTFDQWNKKEKQVCKKGCSTCCTQNVTVTATEAECIHKFAIEEDRQEWLAEILSQKRDSEKPRMTTNDFAKACLEGRDTDPGPMGSLAPCPFLKENICQIYPVRPFACRAFISTSACGPAPATVSEGYVASVTAISQIIEHLGQKEYWGNLFDVLIAMSDISAYKETAEKLTAAETFDARLRTLTAKPLTGFLLTEKDLQVAEPLLQSIFSTQVDEKSIEDILNGK